MRNMGEYFQEKITSRGLLVIGKDELIIVVTICMKKTVINISYSMPSLSLHLKNYQSILSINYLKMILLI